MILPHSSKMKVWLERIRKNKVGTLALHMSSPNSWSDPKGGKRSLVRSAEEGVVSKDAFPLLLSSL